jgi:HPt (histidine-containing phosphotransfer) domain-containing protein
MAVSLTQGFELPIAGAIAGRALKHPIDLVHLSRQTLGESALEVEALAAFDNQAAQIAAKLGASETGGVELWRAELAQKLKGAARAIGAFEVASAAEEYEHRARSGLMRAGDVKALIESIARARRALRELAG